MYTFVLKNVEDLYANFSETISFTSSSVIHFSLKLFFHFLEQVIVTRSQVCIIEWLILNVKIYIMQGSQCNSTLVNSCIIVMNRKSCFYFFGTDPLVFSLIATCGHVRTEVRVFYRYFYLKNQSVKCPLVSKGFNFLGGTIRFLCHDLKFCLDLDNPVTMRLKNHLFRNCRVSKTYSNILIFIFA